MAVSTVLSEIHELKAMSVSVAKTGNNVYMSATVPDGYKFLTWIGFSVTGSVDYTNCSFNWYQQNNIRVWTGKSENATVDGHYIVYR